ncbi:MAG: signal peptidase I [Candidatus Dasytiphilus stammeri]
MAHTLALILAIGTLITGLMWTLDKWKSPSNNQSTQGQFHTTNKWMKTAVDLFPVLLVVFLVRSFILEPFHIPSGSMMPTLLIGDFIMVEKFAYSIKNPITQNTLIKTGHPNRGDIVVFQYPQNTHLDYIKRVIGLPGDLIQYDPILKKLTLKPSCNDISKLCKTFNINYSPMKESNFIQEFSGIKEVSNTLSQIWLPNNNGLRLFERQEFLGKINHRILLIPNVPSTTDLYYLQPGQPKASWLVPKGYYFMMGDNRDNSADSRYWGFVPETNLVGKAIFIWMSFKKQENKLPTGIRLNRIGWLY